MVAGMSLGIDVCSWNDPPPTSAATALDAIQHVIIACQENHAFDMYFGHYPRAGKFGIPSSYSQPDGRGGTVKPHHFSIPTSAEIDDSLPTIHREWNHGAMDGFFTADGPTAPGYFDRFDLAHYYAFGDSFT